MENRPIEDPLVRTVLREFREGLERIYGDRLAHLILFGSRARGDARPDSDIDVMLVLNGPFDLTCEMRLVSPLASEISLAHDTVLSCTYVSTDEFALARRLVIKEARREGFAA